MTDDENKKIQIGEEYEEDTGEEEVKELEGLYDMILPPGVPQKLIIEVMDKFGLEATARTVALHTIDTEAENLLALRGDLESVNKAHDYIYTKLREMYNR